MTLLQRYLVKETDNLVQENIQFHIELEEVILKICCFLLIGYNVRSLSYTSTQLIHSQYSYKKRERENECPERNECVSEEKGNWRRSGQRWNLIVFAMTQSALFVNKIFFVLIWNTLARTNARTHARTKTFIISQFQWNDRIVRAAPISSTAVWFFLCDSFGSHALRRRSLTANRINRNLFYCIYWKSHFLSRSQQTAVPSQSVLLYYYCRVQNFQFSIYCQLITRRMKMSSNVFSVISHLTDWIHSQF